jgi:hypothetical protein
MHQFELCQKQSWKEAQEVTRSCAMAHNVKLDHVLWSILWNQSLCCGLARVTRSRAVARSVKLFFSLYVFGEPAVHFSQFFPLLPLTEVSPRPSAIPDGKPPGDSQSAVGWGDAGFEPGTAGQQSGALQLSHHASQEPPRLPLSHHASQTSHHASQRATPPPREPPRLPNEPPRLPLSHHASQLSHYTSH